MNTKKMNADIADFLKKENISYLEFKMRAAASIIHLRISDACGVLIVDEYLNGSELDEKTLVALFAISKGFDLDDKTRYGQVFHRRVSCWLTKPDEWTMESYGMYWDDLILYEVGSCGSLLGKTMTADAAYASGRPIMDIMDMVYFPDASPCSVVKPTPSTSYQLVKYLKTLTPEALHNYVANVRIPYDEELFS